VVIGLSTKAGKRVTWSMHYRAAGALSAALTAAVSATDDTDAQFRVRGELEVRVRDAVPPPLPG